MNIVVVSGKLEKLVSETRITDEQKLKVTGNLLVGHERGFYRIPFVAYNRVAKKIVGVPAGEKILINGKIESTFDGETKFVFLSANKIEFVR